MLFAKYLSFATVLAFFRAVSAFGYGLAGAGEISLSDSKTGISGLKTIFTGEDVSVFVSGLEWDVSTGNATGENTIYWKTTVGNVVQGSGEFDLTDLASRELLDSLDVGTVNIADKGRHEIIVTLSLDGAQVSTSTHYEAFGSGASIIPLLLVLFLALFTRMVELSLFSAIFVGACMINGNIKDGFKSTLENYILNALADVGHGYVFLFTLFLSGMVGLMEKSGGMTGFTSSVAKYAKSSRAAQLATFAIGCVVFFDDYANTLLAGETMRPLTDMLFVSREKLSFIVDATAAPVASLTPISSWVGFEVSLIQEQIDRIVELKGGAEFVSIETSGLAVFMQSIKYRYYPIFMMILIPLLIWTQRDFGLMLIAERKTQVYQRTDGGDGKGPASTKVEEKKENEARPDTPTKPWNMLVPILLLVLFIFCLLVKTGDDGSGNQSFMEKIESSDSYVALLRGTMAASILTMIFYSLQFVQNGEVVLPTFDVLKQMFSGSSSSSDSPNKCETTNNDSIEIESESETANLLFSSKPRPLMSIFESVEAFLYGMSRIFPALIVLTLAWASGSIMVDVGADRLFSQLIQGGVSAESLPTLSFVISAFMALATGTSWGTMTILFPLICVPAYIVSDSDATIFYATVAGILGGSVAGDHVSPISDTTVLSALATDCKLLNHVSTQAPYTILIFVVSILFGTLPIGHRSWPNIVGILLGVVAIVMIVYGLCVPIVSESGGYDAITALYLRVKGRAGSELGQLQKDTVEYYATRIPPASHVDSDSDSKRDSASTSEDGLEDVEV